MTRGGRVVIQLEWLFFGDASYENLFSAAQDHLDSGYVIAILKANDQ